jgi:Rieske 2Fe-2S family protein
MVSQDERTSDLQAPLDPAAVAAALRPFGESRMLPPQAYTSEAVFGWEQRQFFQGWQCVGRSSDLGEPGSQRAERMGASSVLLTRTEAGELRAFANTCRHRGHELLACGASTRKRSVVCPYHAWTYQLDGSLRAAPGFRDVAGFQPQDYSLVPLRVAEWHGYVFVDPSGTGPGLDVHLGAVGDRVAPHAPAGLVLAASHTYVVEANWKVISENYHECYHCPMIHPQLCQVSPPDSGENWDDALPGAWVGGWMEIRDGMDTMSLDGHSDSERIAGLDDEAARRVDYLQVFPNLLISLHPDYVMTHRMVPLCAGRTWVECAWAFPPDVVAREGFDPAYAVDFWDITNRQDWAACESVQRGLSSGHAIPGPLSPDEDAVYQFVTMVARGYCGLPVHERPARPVIDLLVTWTTTRGHSAETAGP